MIVLTGGAIGTYFSIKYHANPRIMSTTRSVINPDNVNISILLPGILRRAENGSKRKGE